MPPHRRLVLINPEIRSFGPGLEAYEEGCLSIPGVYLNVVRPTTVEVSYRDDLGRPQRMKADGLLARCIQHEMDHLNGVLFVDRVTDELSLNAELQEHGFASVAMCSRFAEPPDADETAGRVFLALACLLGIAATGSVFELAYGDPDLGVGPPPAGSWV
jgi:hypothetical protein